MQLFTLLGGLGLFLYGMQLLSGALTGLASGGPAGLRPRSAPAGSGAGSFGRFLGAVAQGAGVTAVIQSSSAVTLFALSAADAGILPAWEAIGLCWGANLGTTATGHLLALSQAGSRLARLLPAALCPLCCFAGAAAHLFAKGRAALLGQAALGFGLLFTGLEGVQDGLLPLLTGGRLQALLHTARQNYLAAFLLGLVLAAALQSSSAALGLLQAVALSGQLSWEAALPLVLGVNVGTCSTALAACLGAGHDRCAARRVALGHLGFNLAGGCAASLLRAALRDAPFWDAPAGFSSLAWLQTGFNGGTLALLVALTGALHFARPTRAANAPVQRQGRSNGSD